MRLMRCALVLLCLCAMFLGGCEYVRPTGVPSATWVPLPPVALPFTETPVPVTPSPTSTELPTLTLLPKPTTVPTALPLETETPGASDDWAAWARDRVWQHLWPEQLSADVSQFPEWAEIERQELLGATRFAYQSEGWRLDVSVPRLGSDQQADEYEVSVAGPDAFAWEGLVGPDGVKAIGAEPTPTLTPTPRIVRDWLGTVHKLPDGSQYDDYVQVIGDGAGQYGITAVDAILFERLIDLADSGQVVRFSGTLLAADDYGSVQIQVTDLTLLSPPPTAQPISEMVEGWVGIIRPLPKGSAYDDYFDGQNPVVQWGIEGAMAPVTADLDRFRESGAPVRIWGVLDHDEEDYGQGRISVLRIEPLS